MTSGSKYQQTLSKHPYGIYFSCSKMIIIISSHSTAVNTFSVIVTSGVHVQSQASHELHLDDPGQALCFMFVPQWHVILSSNNTTYNVLNNFIL